eukprot:TRINITY_DN70864_c0_g1_i1.p1 TRINITY_DN70864_c0_g1~~TRINITY_DN70864_c0_g1_i1.p1  ORF type:complete len:229 (-),score=49.63 TRINITY_DN70864_c0_g1_i1:25-711(-)
MELLPDLLAAPLGDSGGMHAKVSEWRVHKPPAKATRKRIVCPTRAPDQGRPEQQCSLPQVAPGRHASQPFAAADSAIDLQSRKPAKEPKVEKPFTVTIRVLYFSRDGAQADAGGVYEFDVLPSLTIEELVEKARSAAGTKKGKLLFRMRPLKDGQLTVSDCNIAADPKALHLMLSRRHRPQDVAEKAAAEEAELKIAMANAAAEAALRPKKERRQVRPPSGGSVVDEW